MTPPRRTTHGVRHVFTLHPLNQRAPAAFINSLHLARTQQAGSIIAHHCNAHKLITDIRWLPFVDCVKTSNRIVKLFSPSDSHTILIFPYQMAWQYSDGNPPNGSVEGRWSRQKSRFWVNIWLHRMLWTVPAASAIHLAATDRGEFTTLVAGKRRSFWMAGDDDEVYDKKPQRYPEDNVRQR